MAEPIFHEQWYGDLELADLCELAKQTKDLQGENVEIGCWEGKSTLGLLNALYPQALYCVDTWKGNEAEKDDHPSILIARERDVYADFDWNVKNCSQGNYIIYRQYGEVFLSNFKLPIKFFHLDASHDYASVVGALRLVIPRLVPGAIVCGDDYVNACKTRLDLDGGVERAVCEIFPAHQVSGNLWWWRNE